MTTPQKIRQEKSSLPVIADCEGCGVCCFHMGYPAFRIPVKPLTDEEIDADPNLVRRIADNPQLRSILRNGDPGETHWHSLPEDLKSEWEAYVHGYQIPDYGSEPETFDGPCIWLDLETRRCQHHEHRPRVCREFEVASTTCRQWRAYYPDRILLKRPDEN